MSAEAPTICLLSTRLLSALSIAAGTTSGGGGIGAGAGAVTGVGTGLGFAAASAKPGSIKTAAARNENFIDLSSFRHCHIVDPHERVCGTGDSPLHGWATAMIR